MSTVALPMSSRITRRLFPLLLCLGCAAAAAGTPLPQRPNPKPSAAKPISKPALLKAVKLAAESGNAKDRAANMKLVTQQVAAQGLDFLPTAADEEDVRAAGASPELLAALRLKREEAEMMELREWKTVKESKLPADFAAFLKKYPTGEFAVLARERLEQTTWDALKDSSKAEDFDAFLKQYPTGKFAGLARERAEQAAWDALKDSRRPADFEAYLQRYPTGKFAAPARARLEQSAWNAVRESDKPAEIEAYLQKYPTGQFADSARARLEELEWAAVKESDKPADFEAFLQKYPTGKFAAPARQSRERLTAPTVTEERKANAETPERKPAADPAPPNQSASDKDGILFLPADQLRALGAKIGLAQLNVDDLMQEIEIGYHKWADLEARCF